ncbi:hypothetical protein ACFYWS_29460 [Streptomyces sp. NPDC002795]|uniref:hypothetical protein n=1 Tax=Streptomyces sp. NPDC002795 TaxID=3364665 RepID=UPI0036C91F6B
MNAPRTTDRLAGRTAIVTGAAAFVPAFDPVGVLVSNAVKIEVAPAHETSPDSWNRQLGIGPTADGA